MDYVINTQGVGYSIVHHSSESLRENRGDSTHVRFLTRHRKDGRVFLRLEIGFCKALHPGVPSRLLSCPSGKPEF